MCIRVLIAFLIGFCLSVSHVSYAGGPEFRARDTDRYSIRVLATYPALAQLTRMVGGRYVRVSTLLQPGQNPDTATVALRELQFPAEQLLVTIGVPNAFETCHVPLLTTLNPQLSVAEAAAGIPQLPCDTRASGPWLWQSLPNACQMAATICRSLILVDPRHAAYYKAQLVWVVSRLAQIDQQLRQLLARYPKTVLVSDGPYWHYLAREYGIDYRTLTADSQIPGAREMGQLRGYCQAKAVSAVFHVPFVSPVYLSRVTAGSSISILPLDPFAADFTDELVKGMKKLVTFFPRSPEVPSLTAIQPKIRQLRVLGDLGETWQEK